MNAPAMMDAGGETWEESLPRREQTTNQGQSKLTTVGMPGQHHIYRELRVRVQVFRAMAQEHAAGSRRRSLNCPIQVLLKKVQPVLHPKGIVNTGDP
jgi:hypothetical protein